jgi:hypothetical protein
MQGTSFERFRRWSVLTLLNLVLVSILGVLLRYKIAFPLQAINYNFLLQAHSHFAFSGWISTAIFTALVYLLFQSGYPVGKIYTFQFRLAQTASFGMLLTFPFEGYGPLSIFFSMLFIVFSWWFALQYWKDTSKSDLPLAVKRWAKAALFFFVLSSTGIFLLVYIKSYGLDTPDLYYNAMYLFLHFQYNGWFSFGVLALFFYTAHYYKLLVDENKGRLFFRLMVAACIPAYCLSLLWMNPPEWVFVIAAVAAFLQLWALIIFILLVSRSWAHWSLLLPFQARLLWGLSLIAFIIKLILQALSVIPTLGRLAFGFRPVIISYLHLVMLGFISFFLIGFCIKEKLYYHGSGVWKNGLVIFITGVLLNEVLLLIQALSAMNDGIWSFATILLFAAATIIFGGVVLMFIAQVILKKNGTGEIPVSE